MNYFRSINDQTLNALGIRGEARRQIRQKLNSIETRLRQMEAHEATGRGLVNNDIQLSGERNLMLVSWGQTFDRGVASNHALFDMIINAIRGSGDGTNQDLINYLSALGMQGPTQLREIAENQMRFATVLSQVINTYLWIEGQKTAVRNVINAEVERIARERRESDMAQARLLRGVAPTNPFQLGVGPTHPTIQNGEDAGHTYRAIQNGEGDEDEDLNGMFERTTIEDM